MEPGTPFTITQFKIEFEKPDHPQLERYRADDFNTLKVRLVFTDQGFSQARAAGEGTVLTIGDLEKAEVKSFYPSALQAILLTIRDHLNRRGLIGVSVVPHPQDINAATLQYLWPAGNTTLRMMVRLATAGKICTLGSGDRIEHEKRIDNDAHDRIRRNSPIQEQGLLDQSLLNEYIYRLNRHPGRRVDAAVSSSRNPGEATLDYMVTENKPWFAYF